MENKDKTEDIAFLIVAHNNVEQLNMFIRQLLVYEGSYIYIHIDAKSLNMIPDVLKAERVTVLPEHYDVKWGDYTQILVNNYLLKYAISKKQHIYYSLHSGADLAIRPVKELIAFLNVTNCYGYYGCSKLRLAIWWWSGTTSVRLAKILQKKTFSTFTDALHTFFVW